MNLPRGVTLTSMTLEYRSANYKPPCQRGLTVWGVLFLLAAGLIGLGLFTMVASMLVMMRSLTAMTAAAATPATGPGSQPVAGGVAVVGMPTFDPNTFIVGIVVLVAVYGLLAIVLGTFGVGMLRRRRWVRPWVLAGSAYTIVTCVAVLPATTLVVAYSQNSPVMILFPVIALFCLGLGISLMLFRYFRKPEMVETLAHFDPSPSRLDRWAVPVFSVAVIAIASGIFGVFGLVGPVRDLAKAPSTGAMLLLVFNGLSAGMYAVGGVFCLVRPRLGWQILMSTLGVGLLFGVIITMFFRDAQLRAIGLAAGSQAEYSLPPTGVLVVSAVTTLLAYAFALWFIRKPFLSPEAEIPMAQLATGN